VLKFSNWTLSFVSHHVSFLRKDTIKIYRDTIICKPRMHTNLLEAGGCLLN
jgi:hypothetical protein